MRGIERPAAIVPKTTEASTATRVIPVPAPLPAGQGSTSTSGRKLPGRSTTSHAAPGSLVLPNDALEAGWSVVYSDGACKGNGKSGSVAGVGVWWGPNDPRFVPCAVSTSDRTLTLSPPGI